MTVPVVTPVLPIVEAGKPPEGAPDPNAWDIASLPAGAQKYITELRAEAASNRVALKDVNDKLAQAKTPEEFAAAQRDAAEAQRLLLLDLVAIENKVPANLKDRLRGNTREELDADAKSLGYGPDFVPGGTPIPPVVPEPVVKPGIPNPTGGDVAGGLNPNPSSTNETYDPAALAEIALKARGTFIR